MLHDERMRKAEGPGIETGTGDGGVEVNTLEEQVNLNRGLSSRGKRTLETLASSIKTIESTSVGGEALLVLALGFVDKVVDKTGCQSLHHQGECHQRWT